jgi:hypothetical protein
LPTIPPSTSNPVSTEATRLPRFRSPFRTQRLPWAPQPTTLHSTRTLPSLTPLLSPSPLSLLPLPNLTIPLLLLPPTRPSTHILSHPYPQQARSLTFHPLAIGPTRPTTSSLSSPPPRAVTTLSQTSTRPSPLPRISICINPWIMCLGPSLHTGSTACALAPIPPDQLIAERFRATQYLNGLSTPIPSALSPLNPPSPSPVIPATPPSPSSLPPPCPLLPPFKPHPITL